jgi:hypothetical protein
MLLYWLDTEMPAKPRRSISREFEGGAALTRCGDEIQRRQ